MKFISRIRSVALATVCLFSLLSPVVAQKAPAGYTISRKNLANVAAFTVTQTTAPKEGAKFTQIFQVEVKGNKARLDYKDAALGDVRYLANEKGIFFFIPANKSAVQQEVKGGIDGALKLAFSEANQQMRTAKKVGTATVSGLPTDIYKDAQSGATIYLSKKEGFRFPVKTVLANEGGTRTVLVTGIKLNHKIADTRFALPAGTQIVDSNGNRAASKSPGNAKGR